MKLKTAALAMAFALAAGVAQAATFTTNFWQAGSDVQASGQGAFDLDGMTPIGDGMSEHRIWSVLGFFLFGTQDFMAYGSTFSGPGIFGNGGEVQATQWNGDSAGLWVEQGFFYVPLGYVSGSALSNAATWANTTLADLGLSTGTYSYTFGTNTYNVIVGDASVPTVPVPATLPLVLAALGGLALLRRRKA